MWALFGFLFALRVGPGPARVDPVHLSIRDEARLVAADRSAAQLALDPVMSLDASPAAPSWPSLASPGAGPHFQPYRSEDFVAQVVARLHVDRTPLGQAAMWLAASNVQLDAGADRFYVRVKFRM